MTDSEFLAEAYKKYPEGTEFYSSIDNKDGTKLIVKYPLSFEKFLKGSRNIIWNNSMGWLHSNGRWATIVSYPKNYKPLENLINKIEIW